MVSFRAAVGVLFSALCGIASAVPVATMTFDVEVMGMAHLPSGVYLITPPVKSTAVISFPFQLLYSGISTPPNSTDRVTVISPTTPAHMVQISSPLLEQFDISVTNSYLQQGLAELGLQTNGSPISSMNYANMLKRQRPDSSYYTMFDANSDLTTYDLQGDNNATLMSRVAVWGVGEQQDGDLAPFDLSDLPQMLMDINDPRKGGYNVQYTVFVDRFKDIKTHEGGERPIEVTFGGSARLTSFTIDGQEMIEGTVPEPSSLALIALGFLGCLLVARKNAKI
jgi:hypothetical protein